MAQFILSDEEIEIIIDALTTEVIVAEVEETAEKLKEIEALRERFLPYTT